MLWLWVACGGEPEVVAPAPAARPPHVVLVTIDTLRADHLGAWGHTRPTSPWLDQRAGESRRYANAFSTASWTAPSFASLMTGLHPKQHGVVTADAGDGTRPGLPAEVPVLAEQLKERGYATFGVTANLHLNEAMGFNRGFDHFTALGMVDDAQRVKAVVDSWVLPSDQPVFLWIHILDPHGPYWPNQPWALEFCADLPQEGLTQRIGQLYPLHAPDHDQDPAITADSVDLRILEALYDSEIRLVDGVVQALDGKVPPSEDRVWVLTSDHGEAFREHGRIGHWQSLYPEEVHVPLLIHAPGRLTPGVHEAPVSLVDVGGAVLALVEGRPVEFPAAPIYAEANLRSGPGYQRSVLAWPNLLVVDEEGVASRFDLSADPGAQTPLPATAELQALLEEHAQRPVHTPTVVKLPDSDEELQQLRAMGYVD